MRCPNCGSDKTHSISEVTNYTNTKGYGCCKGLLGYVILGPIGFLCGLCGMGRTHTTTHHNHLWKCSECGKRFK